MSFMFRSILHTINGTRADSAAADADAAAADAPDGQEQESAAAAELAKPKSGSKNRRRLSAMIGRMSVSGSKSKSSNDKDVANNDNEDNGDDDDDEDDKASTKSAYVLPEEQCDIPTFLHTKNCDVWLIEETRKLLRERYRKNPDAFYAEDYKRMQADDWTVSRFLLRRRLDPKRTAKLMEECGRFRKTYKMSEVQLWEFPIEFHKAGGLFMYAPDRVGNITVYMRVKMYRRVPEISDVFKAFILCVLEEADKANNGRGVAVVFDLTGCGLQNVDLSFLSWLLSSFRNYCPKGVSYILVYNLPWILNATCKLAMSWMSASNRRSLRFVYSDEIENFIARDNLPDYLNGTCKLNYKAIPENSKPAIEVCQRLDISREQALKIRELFKEYLDEDDEADEHKYANAAKQADSNNNHNNTPTTTEHSDANTNVQPQKSAKHKKSKSKLLRLP